MIVLGIETSCDETAAAVVADAGPRIRSNLDQPKAAVHVIGGIGGSSTAEQYRRVVTASRPGGAVGISLYDFRISEPTVWPILR